MKDLFPMLKCYNWSIYQARKGEKRQPSNFFCKHGGKMLRYQLTSDIRSGVLLNIITPKSLFVPTAFLQQPYFLCTHFNS